MDRHAEFVSEPLKLVLPDVRSIAVAAVSVGVDEDLAGLGIAFRADLGPPSSDRRDREHRRVVIDTHAHEAIVGGKIVDAVRDGLADCVRWKVVHISCQLDPVDPPIDRHSIESPIPGP